MKRLAAACLLVGASTSAQAQRASETELGSHIPVPMRARIPVGGNMPEVTRGRLVMAQFARCVVDRQYPAVARTMALASAEFERQVGRLATPDCLDSGMIRFKPTAIRGPLFRELYVRRSEAAARGRTWGPTVDKISLSASAVTDETERMRLSALAFGSCVVQRNEQGARQVVIAATGSAAQDQAIKTIVPELSACLTQGSQLRIGKTFIEAVLAEVLYRGVDAQAATVRAVAESK